jgi:hypothetical protein
VDFTGGQASRRKVLTVWLRQHKVIALEAKLSLSTPSPKADSGPSPYPGPISGPSGGRSAGPLPECAKRVGKGERAARTICQWQIVRPERTARKRRAGRLLAQGPGNSSAPSLWRGEPRPTEMTVDDRQASAHPAQARGRVGAGAGVGAVP